MDSDTEEPIAVEVDLPAALLARMDAFAARRGYASPDDLVQEAIDRIDEP